jgi:16S rRNA processing protein RimM
VAIARLLRSRGNKGELAAESWTSRPERFQALKQVTLWPSGAVHQVESVWWHGDVPVFAFAGIQSISDAERIAGQWVSVPLAERVELEPDEVFYGDLIGCQVVDRKTGQLIGVVDDYQESAGPILLNVGPHVIPFVGAYCVVVDLAAKRIEVELPEGFLELNA